MKEAEIRPQDLFNRYLELSRRDIERFFPDREGFVQVPCPACGGSQSRPGLEKLGFTYLVCTDCLTLYVSPRPAPDRLEEYYRDAESVRFWSSDFYRATAEARREKIFQPRAALVASLVQRRKGAGEWVLVDVGSGFGIFLDEVRRLGQFDRVVGLEPNPGLALVCRQRGFPVLEKPLEQLLRGECEADVATAFEVLEHVSDPLAFLTAARRLLKPGGLFLFTTLTSSGFDIQVLWARSKSVHPPHHLNFISVEGMRRLVERAGLRLRELTTPGELDVDIVANASAEDPSLELPRFVSYMLAARDEATRRNFQEFLRNNLLSSHIRVVAAT